jgi:hypothetical protein
MDPRRLEIPADVSDIEGDIFKLEYSKPSLEEDGAQTLKSTRGDRYIHIEGRQDTELHLLGHYQMPPVQKAGLQGSGDNNYR